MRYPKEISFFNVSFCRCVRKSHLDQSVWDLFIQNPTSNNGGSRTLSKAARSVLQDIHEINNWIEKLLDSPVPEEGRTRVELELFPKHIIPRQPLVFALPEKQSKCISIKSQKLINPNFVMKKMKYT